MSKTQWSQEDWLVIEASSRELLSIAYYLNERVGSGGGNTSTDALRHAII